MARAAVGASIIRTALSIDTCDIITERIRRPARPFLDYPMARIRGGKPHSGGRDFTEPGERAAPALSAMRVLAGANFRCLSPAARTHRTIRHHPPRPCLVSSLDVPRRG